MKYSYYTHSGLNVLFEVMHLWAKLQKTVTSQNDVCPLSWEFFQHGRLRVTHPLPSKVSIFPCSHQKLHKLCTICWESAENSPTRPLWSVSSFCTPRGTATDLTPFWILSGLKSWQLLWCDADPGTLWTFPQDAKLDLTASEDPSPSWSQKALNSVLAGVCTWRPQLQQSAQIGRTWFWVHTCGKELTVNWGLPRRYYEVCELRGRSLIPKFNWIVKEIDK